MKPAPILFEEKEFAVWIIKAQKFQRPLMKIVHHYFGMGIDLMLSKGQALENISVRMWHSILERTWKSYKQRKKYHIQVSVPW